jgi:tetratricopeptide (TPR) repeat protein
MKVKFLILFVILCLPCLLNAKDRDMNELPMYGGKHNPTVEQNKQFSASAAKLGWQYYYRGDLDTAMKRFNQAWMFDRDSIDALWGFGMIMGQRSAQEDTEHNLKESIRFLDLAIQKSPQNARILVDLAFSHTLFGQYLNEKGIRGSRDEFLKAGHLYESAEKLDKKYPLLQANWSVLEFYMGNYLKAQERLEQAKKLGFQPDPAYVKDIESKLKK